MANDQDITIRVTVDSSGAVKSFEQLGNKVTETKKSAEEAGQGFTRLEAQLVSLQAVSELARKAMETLGEAFHQVDELAQLGDRVQGVSNSFDTLASEAGVLAHTFRDELTKATEGAVSQFDLLQTANKALLRNLDPSQILTLAGAAETLGKAVGLDATESFNTLVEAVGRGNRRLLEAFALQVHDGDSVADVMDKIKKRAESLGQAANTAGDQLDKLAAGFKNFKNDFAAAFSGNQDLGAAIQHITEGLNKLTGSSSGKSFGDAFASEVAKVVNGIGVLLDGLGKLKGAIDKDGIGQGIADMFGTPSSDRAIEVLNARFEGVGTIVKGINEEIGRLGTNIHTEELDAMAQDLALVMDKLSGEDFGRNMKAISDYVEATAMNLEKARESATNITELSVKGAGAAGKAVAKPISEEFAKQIETSLTNAITSAINLAFQAGANHNDLAKGFGGILGTAGGAIAGFAIGGPVGGPVGAAIGASIGNGIGSAVGDAVGHLFDHNPTAGTVARHQIEDFLDQAFDVSRLQVLIGDKLTKVFDFSFSGVGGGKGPFAAAFQDLPAQAQQAFDGVGIALNGLKGTTEDISGQIAVALEQNLDGSLNNLQIAIGALGLSADDMAKQVEEAFNRGNISATEAEGAFNGIAQIMTKGIPDGVGLVDQAFQNVFNAGAKGGRVLLDALGDIGAEAKELGIKDIGGLKAKLEEFVAAGKFTQEQVDGFFQALADNGIKSVQGLYDASNKTLIAIAAELQNQGVLKTVDGVVQSILALPDEKTVNIKVNTQFTGDGAAAKAIGLNPTTTSANIPQTVGAK